MRPEPVVLPENEEGRRGRNGLFLVGGRSGRRAPLGQRRELLLVGVFLQLLFLLETLLLLVQLLVQLVFAVLMWFGIFV